MARIIKGSVSQTPFTRVDDSLGCQIVRLVTLYADPDGRRNEEAGTVETILAHLRPLVASAVADLSASRRGDRTEAEAILRRGCIACRELFPTATNGPGRSKKIHPRVGNPR